MDVNVMGDAIKTIEHANSFKVGDIVKCGEAEVEFIKFHIDDPTRYLFWGKILKSDTFEIGTTKRNFYTHKFTH